MATVCGGSLVSLEFTECNFLDFSNIQILREINFGESKSAKIVVFPI